MFFVERYDLHPQYRRIQLSTNQVIWDYDVAVIEAYSGTLLQGFPHVEPTVLPQSCASECCGVCGGVEIRLAGWVSFKKVKKEVTSRLIFQGRLANGSIPTYLQQLEQHVISQSECASFWEGQVTDRMFCVTADFYDSCDGDSGSAILLTGNNQVGYVSFGSMRCGDGSAPAVYGRLEHPSIRDFIRQISGL